MITEEDRKLFQEAFDKSVKGILAQGRKSYVSMSPQGCSYRGDDDCKCAVGHLIPDEEYDVDFESNSVKGLRDKFNIAALKPFFDQERFPMNDGVLFLSYLQQAHDFASTSDFEGRDEEFIKSFSSKAKEIAGIYKLDTSVLG